MLRVKLSLLWDGCKVQADSHAVLASSLFVVVSLVSKFMSVVIVQHHDWWNVSIKPLKKH